MRSSRRMLLATLILLSPNLGLAEPPAPLLVDSAWLAAHRNDPRLVLLHVGQKAEYDAGHIPGARHVPFGSDNDPLSVSDHSGEGLMLEVPPAETLRRNLEGLGIADDSHVVVYYGRDWVSPSTRVLFTLDHAGLEAVSLLDGGMTAWKAAGQPLTAEVPPPRRGSLRPLRLRGTVVDAAGVRERAGRPGFALIDARLAAFYDGVEVGSGHARMHRVGHIAGAGSLPFDQVVTADWKLKPKHELEELFRRAGVRRGDTIVVYCHIGQQATAVLFAARTLGYPALLYDGSFEDWSRGDGPVEKPAAR